MQELSSPNAGSGTNDLVTFNEAVERLGDADRTVRLLKEGRLRIARKDVERLATLKDRPGQVST